MKRKTKFIFSALYGLLVLLLIFLVLFVDVKQIGAENTTVGLSHLNGFVFELFGINLIWYYITDWLGVVAIFIAFLFATIGAIQFVKRKSIFKVDKEILTLGGLYILVIGLYLLFEFAIVNYRPIIMPNCSRPEASFPSSHTMIVCVIMGSAIMLSAKYIKQKTLCKIFNVFSFIIIGITVIGRLVSGVHWFTDIVGGILISITLLTLFSAIKSIITKDCILNDK